MKKSVLGVQLCNSITLTADDTSIINDRILVDLADGDAVVIDVPNNIAEGKKGKNGNALISYNATGEQVTVVIRTPKGSPDDKFFNKELNTYRNDKAGYILLSGSFIKNAGDGFGNVTKDIYTMTAGFIQKIPTIKENVEGDTEQAVTVYNLLFMNADRSIS